MATIVIHDRAVGKVVGSTHLHYMPRIGEGISWQGNLWRVMDIAHETNDEKGAPIAYPLVLVQKI